ncbi:MAG: argG [Caloramator sp.]|jgi:argininosuccinate synthase|uniref:argininosuccinate synthase n=1 Tax=Caloramator sp. TaxID=1871330 RepID=UPI001D5BCA0A|nr:argininosuccinate synthase [Caloramator sp.]MBZ4663008.1 argG [Caloramator sp.]
MEKVVLAYSGGLDTSIIIPYLKENFDLEIVAVYVDVGQGEDTDYIRQKALKSGAIKVYIEDARREFAYEYLSRAIKARAMYEGKYLLGTSFARPLITKKLVEIAEKEGAKYIAHGCTGKGNDQVRFEVSIFALNPNIKVIAPWRIWDIRSREDAIDYANEKGIEVPVTKEKIYSVDKNLWHVSHEGGDLEDIQNPHNPSMYDIVTPLEMAKDEPDFIEVVFEKGEVKSVDGIFDLVEIIEYLNKIGGEHGIGIVDILENRLVGMKSRGVYETPAGTILYAAHRELEYAVLDKETLHYKEVLVHKYAEVVYNGLWFTTIREALDAFIDKTQENVTGKVKLKLYKGNVIPYGVFTENALYDKEISSFGFSELYNHKDAEGFIKLYGLPVKIKSLKQKYKEEVKV